MNILVLTVLNRSLKVSSNNKVLNVSVRSYKIVYLFFVITNLQDIGEYHEL